MKNKFILSIFSFLLIQSSIAAEQSAQTFADYFPKHDYTHYDPEVGKGDPFLYEIRIPNQKVLPGIRCPYKTRFFLLGSQHDVPIEILQRRTHHIVEKADVYITEIYDTEVSYLGNFNEVTKEELDNHNLCEGDLAGWRKYLNPAAQAILDEKITPQTQKLWGINGDEVSYHLILEYIRSRERAHKYYDNHGMDYALDEFFEEQNKTILALEIGKVRIEAGDELSKLKTHNPDHFYYYMNELGAKLERFKNPPTKPVDTNVEHYSTFFSQKFRKFERDEEVINRNIAWIPVLKNHLIKHQDETVLICVGYLHLKGEGSLIELLKQEGFEIIKINKKGHTSPRLTSFCDYTMTYTYEELLKEAAEEEILNRDTSHIGDPKTVQIAQERYRKDYEEFLSFLEFYKNPQNLDAEMGPGDLFHNPIYDKMEKYCALIKNYERSDDKHSFYQWSNKGDYYLERLFSTELAFATSLILKNVRLARQKEEDRCFY